MLLELRNKRRAFLVALLQLRLASFATAVQGPAERSALLADQNRLALLRSEERARLEDAGLPRRVGGWSDTQEEPGKVLVFWAVGSKPRAITLVRQNIELLRSQVAQSLNSSEPLKVDIFLAHYDHNRSAWMQTEEDAAWYNKNVQFSLEQYGYKMKLVRDRLVNESILFGPETPSYEWLWLLDEDADFGGGTSLRTLVREARGSRALILGPSVIKPAEVSMERFADRPHLGCQPGMPMCQLASPDPRCRYRYTNFVEVMFTFIKPHALKAALDGCPDCLHQNSVWGLDKTWCAITAKKLKRSRHKTCGIIDRVTVIHENLKTLAKWKGPASKIGETGNQDVLMTYHLEMRETKRKHPREFQEMPQMLECVPEEAPVEGPVESQTEEALLAKPVVAEDPAPLPPMEPLQEDLLPLESLQ